MGKGKGKGRKNDLAQQIADFEQSNPKIAEAMRLFGVTVAKYQNTLYAMNSPRLYQSSSTAVQKRRDDGKLE
jgi:hypothetical protein